MDNKINPTLDYSFINCCAICGSELIQVRRKNIICFDCCDLSQGLSNCNVPLFKSKEHKDYYKKLALEKYNDENKWETIFVEMELSNNPNFDIEKYNITCDKHKKSQNKVIKTYTPNLPKCPTCGSTNIKKISDLRKGIHGLAWGILSKTARSQFECRNCGYKW